MKTLLSVTVVELSGDEIGKMRKNFVSYRHFESKFLPAYCVNPHYGNVTDSEAFLQFVNEGEDVYTLFDIETTDPVLNEELSNAGAESLLFKTVDIRTILAPFRRENDSNYKRCLNPNEYLIVEIKYYGGDSAFGDDWDIDVKVVGAMVGDNLNLIEY